MKFRKEILQKMIAEDWFCCRFCELKDSPQEKINHFIEDNGELLYTIWKKGHKIWIK